MHLLYVKTRFTLTNFVFPFEHPTQLLRHPSIDSLADLFEWTPDLHMSRWPPSCSLEFPSRRQRPKPLSEPAVHYHILIETINFSWANKRKDKLPHVESLLPTLHKGGDQSVCMNFLYHWPFASLVSTFKICRCANHFYSVFFFFFQTQLLHFGFFSPSCCRRDINAAQPLPSSPQMAFLTHQVLL